MATNNFIKKITPLDSSVTYSVNDPILNEVIFGTQTAATGTWTGKSNTINALYNGLQIRYYLPYNGSGNATLNLTLADGSTTGAINCYYSGNNRLTTHYAAGNVITLTYFAAGQIKVNGTATSDARWIADANYDSGNNTSTIRAYYGHPKTGTNGIKQYSLFARTGPNTYDSFTTDSGATTGTKTTLAYDISKIYYYNGGGNVAANTVLSNNTFSFSHDLVDLRYSLNFANKTLTTDAPFFIVFNEQSINGYHTLADTWWAQAFPTTDDGKIYVQVGTIYGDNHGTYGNYRADLWLKNQAFIFKDGALRTYEDTSVVETDRLELSSAAYMQYNDTTKSIDFIFE